MIKIFSKLFLISIFSISYIFAPIDYLERSPETLKRRRQEREEYERFEHYKKRTHKGIVRRNPFYPKTQ